MIFRVSILLDTGHPSTSLYEDLPDIFSCIKKKKKKLEKDIFVK